MCRLSNASENKQTPLVSVIIPTYNRAHLLGRAVRSVINQTFEDFEIIIVDDASTDGTHTLVKSLEDKRISYIKLYLNQGASIARNVGIQHAQGEYIAFLDSDDEWFPLKLKKQLDVFKDSPPNLGLVYTKSVTVTENSEKPSIVPLFCGNLLPFLLVYNYIGLTSTPLIRKECFSKSGFFDESLPVSEDWDMWIRISQYYECSFVPETLVRYLPQADSIIKSSPRAIKAHKRILLKYQHLVAKLPRRFRSERYFYEGLFFWWMRDIYYSIKYFIFALLLNPFLVGRMFSYFIIKIRRQESNYLPVIHQHEIT
jgi:glycosyltransferase involved in cell wall biosynthesis